VREGGKERIWNIGIESRFVFSNLYIYAIDDILSLEKHDKKCCIETTYEMQMRSTVKRSNSIDISFFFAILAKPASAMKNEKMYIYILSG
jgi:hypothetical protein